MNYPLKIIIITPSLIDFSTKKLKIGGLETYIKDLALICKKDNCDVTVFQYVTESCEGCMLEGILVKPLVIKSNYQKTFDILYKEHTDNVTTFILATDQMDIKSKAKNVISIQHGIAFDIPGDMIAGFWGTGRILQHVNKFLRCLKNVFRLYNTRNTVCVDYNYYNWFRTLGTISDNRKVMVIPNYTTKLLSLEDLEYKIDRPNNIKKIVFARRFVDYRGTLMFANAVQRLLLERNDIEVTFAGSGPLENVIKKMFDGNDKVSFSSFNASESIEFHKKFDIAVVPTIFSEGTSLSLCEAMAAGCLGIATHVGGLTNILIDNYNGFLCAPSENSLYNVLHKALNLSSSEYKRIVRCGYNTVKSGFSSDLWSEKWLKMIRNEN